MTLQHMIAEAVALAGGNLCASGHDWIAEGGRQCPRGNTLASQTVYVCNRCGEYDYGQPGGPGHDDCKRGKCTYECRENDDASD